MASSQPLNIQNVPTRSRRNLSVSSQTGSSRKDFKEVKAKAVFEYIIENTVDGQNPA